MTTSSPPASAAPRPRPASFGAGRLSPSDRSGDGLSKAQLRGVVFAIAALHVGAGWGLLQIPAVREVVADVAPIFVDYIAPPPPPPAKPAPPPPPAPPVVRRPPPPVPLITSKPSPAPAPFVAPPPPMVIPAPTPPAAPAPEAPAAPPAPPAVAAPPGPVLVRNVEYLFQPKLEYPERALQLGETGRVLVRVVVDVNGLPRTVTIEKSSGYARLNQAALAATKKARFKPHTINGQPVEMESLIPFEFQQEN